MNPPNDKLILHSLSTITFLVSIAILAIVSTRATLNPSFHHSLLLIALALFNIGILSSWFVLGIGGGLAFLLLAFLAIALVEQRLGYPWRPACIGSFLVTGAVGYVFRRKYDAQEQSCSLRTENMEEDLNLLADGIRRKRTDLDALRRKIERYATLKEVAEVLSTTLSLDEIAQLVVDSSMRIVGKADRGLLYLIDKDKQELALHVSQSKAGVPKVKEKKGDVFDMWVFKQRKPLLIEDTGTDFRFSQTDLAAAKEYFRSLISVPLILESKMMGVLRLDSAAELTYIQEDLRLLDIIADLAAVAVENSRLYTQTEELAIKDGLTDLAVHRYFKERLKEETKRATRTKSTFSLLILDIDHFKEYNDKYGHISGDVVLRYLSGVLKTVAKEGDIVARYGGEEFAMILLGREKKTAVQEAEAIREKIKSEPLVLRREKTNLTVSIGVANFPSDTFIAEELIKKADDRLYKAKKEGRNRVAG